MPGTGRALARGLQKPPHERGLVGGDENIKINRLQKITFAEMRSSGVRGVLICCWMPQTHGRTMRLSDHPAHASAGRDDVKILKNIQGRRRKSSIAASLCQSPIFHCLLDTDT